jgi:putative mRNA 3-end processing factor
MVQISFHGAMETVGSSGVLVDTGVEKIVMDYGTRLEDKPPTFPIPIKGKPDAVLLSHCHLDHSGGIPIFCANGSSVPIYSLPVTKELTELLLLDSLKISREEGVKLPFDIADIKETIKSFLPVTYRKPFKLKKTEVIYFDAGHVPGSALVFLKFGNKTILYTGDYNSSETRLMAKADLELPKVDYLITESTYAYREHPERKTQEKQLVEIINDTLANDAVCLVAGFAIGRLQEVLLALSKQGIDYPVYMDGMARKATTIINQHKNLLKEPDELDKALQKVQYVNSERQRKKIIKRPCVILTTSGMLTGGAVVWYLKRLYEDRNASLVLTGYQLEHTPGKILLETGRYITKSLNLEVKMLVKRLDFSAHVGRSGLFDLAEKLNPEKIFCMHGDHTEEFADELRQKGFDAVAPIANNRIFDV